MRKGVFDDDVYEPGDRTAKVRERLGAGPLEAVVADDANRRLRDMRDQWIARISNEEGKSVQVVGFETEKKLIAWIQRIEGRVAIRGIAAETTEAEDGTLQPVIEGPA